MLQCLTEIHVEWTDCTTDLHSYSDLVNCIKAVLSVNPKIKRWSVCRRLCFWRCGAALRTEVSWTASWAQLHKGTIEPDCKKLWSLHRSIPWQIWPSKFSVLLPTCLLCYYFASRVIIYSAYKFSKDPHSILILSLTNLTLGYLLVTS